MATCYRCEKKFGDACEFAQARRIFLEEELPSAIDGGSPKCPGKTTSGKDCGADLVSFPCRGGGGNENGGKRFVAIGIAIVAAVVVILALVMFWWPVPKGTFVAGPDTLVFPYSDDYRSSALIELHNRGEEAVIVDRIDLPSPLFSASGLPVELSPDSSVALPVYFKGIDGKAVEGDATLYSDASGLSKRIRLVANRNPWWVYDKLDQQSTLLRTKP